MKIGAVEYPSLKGKVPDAEWQTRVELAALYRLIPIMGWFDFAGPPASAKIPGEPHYLINPMGFLFEEITASSLVKVTLEGEIVGEQPFRNLEAGWYPMRAVHAARPDVGWLLHTHDEYAIALSARREGLLALSQSAGFAIAGGIAYHDYDGVETYPERMASLQASMGTADLLVLRNHGLMTLGHTAYQAFVRMAALSKACRAQLLAGRDLDLITIGPDIVDSLAEEIRRGPAADNFWPGLLRKLDRVDPSYRQ
jgi:ribulose-5-phosphate 4-epimerase/fuculose-1-phosphate aldolase